MDISVGGGMRQGWSGFLRLAAVALLPVLAIIFVQAAWSGPAHGQDRIRLDDHSKTYGENDLIPDWDSTKISPFFGSGDKFYFRFVHENEQEHFLHVASGDNNSFSVGSKKTFMLPDYPILEWEWKITKMPKGGDVRMKDKDDQAGSMCVIVDPGLTGFDGLCYLWENDGPKGKSLTSTKREESKYIILRTPKTDQLGKWYREERNIYEDYKKLFGKEPKEKAVIGVQIDSDDTESSAEAFYRRIILRK